jgi:hypothetical protein
MGMAGDIWSTGAFSFESPLKELLDTGEYTIEQLLAEDELLQELRGVHPQLIQYFSSPESVTKLVQYIILPIHAHAEITKEFNGDKGDDTVEAAPLKPRDPGEWLRNNSANSTTPEKDPEMKHIRFPYMACEIICCEINHIIDILVDGDVPVETKHAAEEATPEDTPAPGEETPEEEAAQAATDDDTNSSPAAQQPPTRILDLLFSLLYDTAPGQLDDYRAGYFDKILTVLFRRRPEELAKYINEGGSKGADALMEVMFSHLYSHSIMQIAQRLMLPQRPQPPGSQNDENGAEIIMSEEHEPEGEQVLCDWSKSSRALDMLLESLIHPKVPSVANEQELEELRLDLSLNASEVLITIIQNSMLSSETMLSLTSTDTIQRLVEAATTLRTEEGKEPFFSPHESLLTSAMTVLESLILQLGGYGAVGTMFLLPEEQEHLEQLQDLSESDEQKNLIADLGSMVSRLPQLLDAMALLLRHPSTRKWTSPMQFSNEEPQQLLGSSRLRIVRVLESLVLLGDPEVDSKLVQSDCLEICLDLFWEFQWCSMLHQSVANLLVHVFEGQNARIEMQEYFLLKCNLLGRLMDSFSEVQDNGRIAEVVMDLKDMNLTLTSAVASSAASERESSGDPLVISEDDVEAALEKQEAEEMSGDSPGVADASNVEVISTEAVRFESRDASTIGIAAPPQAFRFGYMGHVIIICQALVHACSNEMEQEEQQMQLDGEEMSGDASPGEINPEPLLLAEMVANHELAHGWNEFIISTLAAETAIQSTPLGGYAGTGNDLLHSHRPGLADDGDIMGDDGTEPPPPPRGMLGGGDVIDMDDNDLEIAANMMAGLALQRPPVNDSDSIGSGSAESGDSDKSYNSGETSKDRTGYAFDDPLGKAGALGIELGKLTQYDEADLVDERNKTNSSGDDSNEDDDDDDNSSSSDEEPRAEGGSGEVPVMDLFAGNFDYNQDPDASDADAPTSDTGALKPEEFSNFANFDEAEEAFGEFTSATAPDSALQDGSDSSSSRQEIEEIESMFGKGDHATLLLDETADDIAAPDNETRQEITAEVDETKPVETGAEPQSDVKIAAEEPDSAPETEETADSELAPGQEELVSAPSDELSADEAPEDAPADGAASKDEEDSSSAPSVTTATS